LYSEPSQLVLGPNGPHLFVRREFTTGCGSPGISDRRALIRRKWDNRSAVAAGQFQDNARNVVLDIRWQDADSLKCFLKELRHL
jgi:hypothetical protein